MLYNAQKGYFNARAKLPRVLGNFAHFWDKKKIEKKELIFFLLLKQCRDVYSMVKKIYKPYGFDQGDTIQVFTQKSVQSSPGLRYY